MGGLVLACLNVSRVNRAYQYMLQYIICYQRFKQRLITECSQVVHTVTLRLVPLGQYYIESICKIYISPKIIKESGLLSGTVMIKSYSEIMIDEDVG